MTRAAHELEGHPVGAPRYERQHGDGIARGIDRLNQQAVAVGGIPQPPQRHREAALGIAITPQVGIDDDLFRVFGAQFAMAADTHRESRTSGAVDRLPDRGHVRTRNRE
ncbi:Uncharacterised protein [Mycobacteroides abscessus subsp. abscessus]|nr:Uncharacterised protein [Mycobacteroides abscessus subsp. abscessus]